LSRIVDNEAAVTRELTRTDRTVIIDCHGHYTTAPAALGRYRDTQLEEIAADPTAAGTREPCDLRRRIRESLESAQLRLQRERGTDLTIFSPRASAMGHHLGNVHTSTHWTEHCNELIRRVCDLYPANFAPVCQLPQSPGAPIAGSVVELRRCVEQLGFVGCNLNPDPSGGGGAARRWMTARGTRSTRRWPSSTCPP
jgi:4-oxalmesaconate hydratase